MKITIQAATPQEILGEIFKYLSRRADVLQDELRFTSGVHKERCLKTQISALREAAHEIVNMEVEWRDHA